MPIKYSTETSTRLFRYIHTVDISYNPFDSRANSVRELWRQLQAPRFYKSNPNFKVNTDVHHRPDAPFIVFKLINDTEKRYGGASSRAPDILFDLHLKLDQMDNEYELQGKSIDD